MARQHGFLVGRHPDHHVLVAGDHAKANVAIRSQDCGRLLLVERKYRAVRKRAQPRRRKVPWCSSSPRIATCDPAVVRGEVDAASGGDGHQHVRVAAEAVRLGERAGRHDAEVVATVALLMRTRACEGVL